MSRIGKLLAAYEDAKSRDDAHWMALKEHIFSLVNGFSSWLHKSDSDATKASGSVVSVRAIGMHRDAQGELRTGNLDAGRVGRALHVSLQFDVAKQSTSSPPSMAAFNLKVELQGSEIVVTDLFTGKQYPSSQGNEHLFSHLSEQYVQYLSTHY